MTMPASPLPQTRSNRIRQLLRRGMSAALPRALFLTSGARNSGQVCLTFDDGPDPEHTPRLLDVLDAQGVKATFFVIGQRAEAFPEIVHRIVAGGHTLGNHTWSHRLASELSPDAFCDEVERTQRLLKELAGVSADLFRPPHGKITARQMLRLWRGRQTVVLWNSDPRDYQCRDADEVRERLKARGLQGGDLILMHDNHPYAANVLPGLVEQAHVAGLAFTTVSEWARGSRHTGPAGRKSA